MFIDPRQMMDIIISFPEEKGQGKGVSGGPESGQMKVNALLPTVLHPGWKRAEECSPVPAAGLGCASTFSLASTFHGDLTDHGTPSPPCSDHHR